MDVRPTNVGSWSLVTGLLLCSLFLLLAVVGAASMAEGQTGLSVTVAPQTIDSGQTATLTAVVSGASATYTLQWYSNSGCSGTPIQSSTSNTFTTPALTSTTTYCVVVSSAGGTALTTVTVTVNQFTSASTSSSSASGSTSPVAAGFPWGLVATIVVVILTVVGGLAYVLTRRKGEKEGGQDGVAPEEKQSVTEKDPCAELKKARQDASNEYINLYNQYNSALESPDRDSVSQTAAPLSDALDALKEKIEKIDAELASCLGGHGQGGDGPGAGSGEPPSLPPLPQTHVSATPPTVTPPPTKEDPIPPPPDTPPLTAIPLTVTPPSTKKPPCPDGWLPRTEEVCGGVVTLVVFAEPSVEVEGVYQATDEDIEKAIKGLERYLSAVHVVTTTGGAITDPAGTVGGILLPSADDATDSAAEAAVKGLKALAKRRNEINEVGWASVTYPREMFMFKCIITKGCQDGDWVVTDRSFVFRDLGQRGTPPEAVFQVPEEVLNLEKELPHILGQARSWAIQQNVAPYARVKACRDSCGA